MTIAIASILYNNNIYKEKWHTWWWFTWHDGWFAHAAFAEFINNIIIIIVGNAQSQNGQMHMKMQKDCTWFGQSDNNLTNTIELIS